MENNHVREKAGILVAVVFILGTVLGGVGMHYWEVHAWNSRSDTPRHVEIMKRLTQELSLTGQQQAQVNAIVDEVHSRFHALDDQHRLEYDAIRADGRQRIRAILTPDQLPKYEEFVRHLDQERKNREGAH